MSQRIVGGLAILSWATLVAACGNVNGYQKPPDVDEGRVAGVSATISSESMDTQEALLAVGAALSEIFANEDVRVALGQSINTDIPESTCVTSTGLGFMTTVNFDNCATGSGQAMIFMSPLGINMVQLGNEDAPLEFLGATMTGTLGLQPVEGEPLTYGLSPDIGTGEQLPLTVTGAAGSIELSLAVTASLRINGPRLLVWGEGEAGSAPLTFNLGEPGTVDATGNPPSWEAPPQTCTCPLGGQTSVGTVLTIGELVIDMDLLTDGDGFGNDDFPPFNMDVEDMIFSDASVQLDFEETCGSVAASFGAAEDMVLKVTKAEILTAIDNSSLSDADRKQVRQAAEQRLKDEVTLEIHSEVLAEGAQSAFTDTFDPSVCVL